MSDQYALWREGFKNPDAIERDPIGDIAVLISGFWRIEGAKTKPSYPCAIYVQETATGPLTIFQIGRRKPMNNLEHPKEWVDFIDGSWRKCLPVTKGDWAQALETGFWPIDNKPSRQMGEAEKLGIDVKPGDNRAPVDETISEQIAAAVAKADAIKDVSNDADARTANELADKLNVLFKLGDAERVKEKTPFDQGAKDVQAKWLPIITPATDARERLIGKDGLVKRWLRAEQKRIDDAAAEERRKRQAEVDAENERIRAENAARVAAQAEAGVPDEAPDLLPEVTAAPVEPVRAKAASTFGRSTGLRKVTRGKIIDIGKLLQALSTHKEMVEFAQTLATRAAKAGIELEGMEIETVME